MTLRGDGMKNADSNYASLIETAMRAAKGQS